MEDPIKRDEAAPGNTFLFFYWPGISQVAWQWQVLARYCPGIGQVMPGNSQVMPGNGQVLAR